MRPRWVRVTAAVLLTVMVTLAMVVTLTPTPIVEGSSLSVWYMLDALHSIGVPAWFGYQQLEFSANIVMFIPLGICVGLLLPRDQMWLGALLLPILSVAVEGVQLLFLEDRYATLSDVIANSLGAWIGLLVAHGVLVLVRNRMVRNRAAGGNP